MSLPSSLTPLFSAGSSAAAGYQIERSLRFNSSDSAYASRLTWGTPTNRKKGTFSLWLKRSEISSARYLVYAYNGSANNSFGIYFVSDNTLEFQFGGSSPKNIKTSAVFRDLSAWYHLVFTWDTTDETPANRTKIYVNGVQQTLGTTNYPSQNDDAQFPATTDNYIGHNSSITFNGYLADIHFIDGQALDHTSFTEVSATTGQLIPKAYTGSFGTNGFWLKFSDNSAATAATLGKDYSGNSNNWTPNNLLATQAIAAPFSVFGLSSNSTEPITNIGSLTQLATNVTRYSTVGVLNCVTADFGSVGSWVIYAQTFLNDPSFIGTIGISNNGTSWTSVSVGQNPFVFTGRYIQWARSGSGYGTQTLFSNLNDSDSLVDTPTSFGTDTYVGGEVRGNYCTLNPLDNSSGMTLANGNLDGSETGGGHKGTRATIKFPASGKWYYEGTVTTLGGACCIGAATNAAANPAINASGSYYILVNSSGNVQRYQSFASYTGFDTPAVGTILRVAYDADAQKLWLGLNALWMNGSNGTTGDPATGANATFSSITDIYPAIDQQTSAVAVNFGQRPFAYTAPSGFKALCDTNLPAPVVAKPSTVMDVKLYTGNGSTQTISGLGFSPDLVWIKSRSAAYNHRLLDTIRGATKELYSSTTDAETTQSQSLTAFNSDGFSLGSLAQVNESSTTYAAWTWDAGSTTVTNTQGSITSQVRANASAGFSIVTYTGNATAGATIGHGLGVAPGMIIIKNRDDGGTYWVTYHSALGGTKALALNLTDSVLTNSLPFNNTDPTSSVFTIGAGGAFSYSNNQSGENHVAYCFAPVSGYSSFGSYTGNGSADGPFVYTGFRPRWILIKRTDAADDWNIFDAARSTYNVMGHDLLANRSDAEYTGTYIDCLSNGFKIRETNSSRNASGGTYIYAAFAENPFQYSRAR